jgi:hypothetical protein
MENPAPPVHICFERIIPDELDPEAHVRRAMREAMTEGRRPSPNERHRVARMAVQNSKKWGAGAIVTCRFLDGRPAWQKKVEAIAHEWERVANMTFRFVKSGTANVRISFFADDGSWSAVGRDALNRAYFPAHQPTMNYGWLRDDTAMAEYRRVVLHEFGHALGCIHEHQSPKFNRKWNVQAVNQYFAGPPNYWSPDQIKSNVLEKYSPRGMSTTVFDPKSIMLYAFDAALFTDGKGPTNENNGLSPKDRGMIKRMYPKR